VHLLFVTWERAKCVLTLYMAGRLVFMTFTAQNLVMPRLDGVRCAEQHARPRLLFERGVCVFESDRQTVQVGEKSKYSSNGAVNGQEHSGRS
jgi:hypothetical protein